MPKWRDPRLWALGVPVLVVGGLLVWALFPYGGTVVLLETRARDPSDPFRGDYQVLNYEVSTLNATVSGVANLGQVRPGDTLYVRLQPGSEISPSGQPYWVPTEVSWERVEEVCMRATVTHATLGSIGVEYGIESYFVQKDQEFEAWQGATVSVVVKVLGCMARVSEIQLDGKTWDG